MLAIGLVNFLREEKIMQGYSIPGISLMLRSTQIYLS